MTLFKTHDIAHAFGGNQALRGIDIEIAEGELVALVGPNGSGKTTLLNASTGFLRPDRGRIELDGKGMTTADPAIFARTGLVRMFQLTRIFPKLSVLDNLLAAAPSTEQKVRWDRAHEILKSLEIGDFSDRPAGALSGGQRKLVEFGSCLMLNARLCFLDEPFAAIHPVIKDVMIRAIRAENERGRTFLIVSHDMPVVTRLCPRTICMAAGRVLADGTTDDVLNHPEVLSSYMGRAVA